MLPFVREVQEKDRLHLVYCYVCLQRSLFLVVWECLLWIGRFRKRIDYIWFIVKFFLSPPQICTVEAEKSLCFIVLNMMEVVCCLWFSVRRTVFFLFHSSFSLPRSVKPLPAAALAAVTDWRLSDFLKVGRNYLFNLLCQISPSACGSNWYHSCHFIPLWHATWSHPVMH